MRKLRPIEIFIAGSVLLAIALPLAVVAVQADARNAGAFIRLLVAGAVIGMFIFGFIAAGLGAPPAIVRRNCKALGRMSDFAFTLGLGHWMGTMLGQQYGLVWAFACVIVGGCFLNYFDGVVKRPAA